MARGREYVAQQNQCTSSLHLEWQWSWLRIEENLSLHARVSLRNLHASGRKVFRTEGGGLTYMGWLTECELSRNMRLILLLRGVWQSFGTVSFSIPVLYIGREAYIVIEPLVHACYCKQTILSLL